MVCGRCIRPSSEDSSSRSGVMMISNIVEEGRVEYVPVRAPLVSVPGRSNLRVSSGKSKKGKISRSPVKRRFEITIPPYHLNSIVWMRIWALVLLWTASNPAKSHGVVGDTGGPLLFSRVDCHSCCYFVPILKTALYSLYLLLFPCQLQYEVLSLCSCIC